MKKRTLTVFFAATMALTMSMTAFAGQWQKNDTGWWWQEDDGSYPTGTWKWLDANQDGVAECYYFDNAGYMMEDTTTPDGYAVNADGAWTVDGTVQTQVQQTQQTTNTQNTTSDGSQNTYTDDYSGIYSVPYYESNTIVSYYNVTLTYDAASNTLLYTDPVLGYSSTYTYFGTGYNGWTCFEVDTMDEKGSIFFSAPGVWEYDDDLSIHRQ